LYFRVLRQALLRRALVRAQVLSAAEANSYPAIHGIPAARFAMVRWPAKYEDSPLHP